MGQRIAHKIANRAFKCERANGDQKALGSWNMPISSASEAVDSAAQCCPNLDRLDLLTIYNACKIGKLAEHSLELIQLLGESSLHIGVTLGHHGFCQAKLRKLHAQIVAEPGDHQVVFSSWPARRSIMAFNERVTAAI